MGLFIGAIGKNRSFILKPREVKMHLPSDLLGMNLTDYEPNRSDKDLFSATNKACSLIKAEVKRIGVIEHAALSETKRLNANPADYDLAEIDFEFLTSCLSSHTVSPGGLAYRSVSNDLKHIEECLLSISAIKLERMGLVEKSIATDNEYDYDYYCYSITELGIDTLLKNEDQLHSKQENSPPSLKDIEF